MCCARSQLGAALGADRGRRRGVCEIGAALDGRRLFVPAPSAAMGRPARTPRPSALQRTPWRWLRVAGPLLLVGGFQLVLRKTDLFLTGMLVGAEEVGVYFAAMRTAQVVTFVSFAVDAVAAPEIARRYHRDDAPCKQRCHALRTGTFGPRWERRGQGPCWALPSCLSLAQPSRPTRRLPLPQPAWSAAGGCADASSA